MRNRLGLSVAGLVGLWTFSFYRLSGNDRQQAPSPRLRGRGAVASPTHVSQQVDLSQRRRVVADTPQISADETDGYYRGQARGGGNDNNNCQSVVDDFGNVVVTAAGSLLSIGKPVLGVVSGGGYVYYMVRCCGCSVRVVSCTKYVYYSYIVLLHHACSHKVAGRTTAERTRHKDNVA